MIKMMTSVYFYKSVLVIFILAVVLAIAPAVVFGQTSNVTQVTPPSGAAPITTVDQGLGVFRQTLTWFAMAFWIAAALFVFYAAFLYLTAAGNEQRVQKAHSQLLYAVIAIAIGLMAYGMPALVKNFLGGGGAGGGGADPGGCPPGSIVLPNGQCST